MKHRIHHWGVEGSILEPWRTWTHLPCRNKWVEQVEWSCTFIPIPIFRGQECGRTSAGPESGWSKILAPKLRVCLVKTHACLGNKWVQSRGVVGAWTRSLRHPIPLSSPLKHPKAHILRVPHRRRSKASKGSVEWMVYYGCWMFLGDWLFQPWSTVQILLWRLCHILYYIVLKGSIWCKHQVVRKQHHLLVVREEHGESKLTRSSNKAEIQFCLATVLEPAGEAGEKLAKRVASRPSGWWVENERIERVSCSFLLRS